MDIWLFAFCLLPIMAIIGAVVVVVRERNEHDRRGYRSR
jgi:hypothetical protein